MEMQVYLFSSIFLILTGVMLSNDKFGSLLKYEAFFQSSFIEHRKVCLFSAILSMLFGLLQILQPVDIAVVGDIIPALSNIIGGTCLLFRTRNTSYEGKKAFVIWLHNFIKTNISLIGLVMVIVGIIHAIFPEIVLL